MTIREAVYEAVREFNESALEVGDPLIAEDPDAVLFGDGRVLDSAGLVTFIVEVERAVNERHGIDISLADERAFSQSRSPFRSLNALVEYVEESIEEQSAT